MIYFGSLKNSIYLYAKIQQFFKISVYMRENIEIEVRYQQLIALNIQHEYFKQIPNDFFRFVPSQETAKTISQIGMQLYAGDKGFNLMLSSDKSGVFEFFLQNQQDIVLDFYLHIQNPYFLHFTQLPWELNKKIFYFDTEVNDIDEKEYFLGNDEFVSAKDAYFYTFDKWKGKKIKKTSKIFGKSKYNNELSDKIEIVDDNYVFNLSELSFGLYQIEEDKNVVDAFLHLPKQLKTPAAMFQVRLGKGWQQKILQLLNDNQSLPCKNMGIKFKARQAYWRYYLLSKYSNNLQNLAINTGQEKIIFKEIGNVVLPNGKEALQFESEKPLMIQDENLYQFELARKAGGRSNATDLILQKLPSPSIDSIKPDKTNIDIAYSDMYVYL
ncbi:MAG: hypothetical protein EAZ85_03960 [Bacteroidetes bacterium]|nr:MAG: hypothetical protein EAZ85_03960 [Bacteroidota bacterium]TAG90699.1 MAG: hypothetical protein EAZ20_03695 [Bacteroidota bacterium]